MDTKTEMPVFLDLDSVLYWTGFKSAGQPWTGRAFEIPIRRLRPSSEKCISLAKSLSPYVWTIHVLIQGVIPNYPLAHLAGTRGGLCSLDWP
jgi:hypothetical protein